MSQNVADTIALLERFPASLHALLHGLPEFWIRAAEGEQTWSAFDIVGHLIHLDRHHWMARVRTILQSGESRPLEPVDSWAQQRESEGRQLPELLAEFASLRAGNLAGLRALNLQPEDLALPGRHPTFGQITLGQALATWVVHDMTHLHQLSRILARQYREEAGPWKRYLGVLHCEGHGES